MKSQSQGQQHREGSHCTDGESEAVGGDGTLSRTHGGVQEPLRSICNKRPSPLRFWSSLMVPRHVPALGADTERWLETQVLVLDVLGPNSGSADYQHVALGRLLNLPVPQAPMKWEGYY